MPKKDWIPAVIKAGSKGSIACEFAFVRVTESRDNLPAGEVWLILRRNLDNPLVIKYYLSNAPANTLLSEFVRISGMRWPIETIFEEGKGEVGMDHYEMQSWLGWHHHMLLVALAHHFLVRLRIRFQDQAPALTVQTATKKPDRSPTARRKSAIRKAIQHADYVNAMIFAGAVNSKWGDYDIDKLDPTQWGKEKDENEEPENETN